MVDSTRLPVPAKLELAEIVRPDSDITELFGAFLASFSNLKTRKSYREDLAQWLAWCDALELEPLALKRTHIDLYMAWLTEAGYAMATKARRLSTVRSFYNWCLDEEILDASPAARVRPPHVERPDMPSLNKHQVHRLLNVAEDGGDRRPSETAIVMVLFLCALRVSEACSLNIGDARTEDYVPIMSVIGKGDRKRTIVVPTRAMAWLDRAAEGRDVGPAILNRAGNRMTRSNASRVVQRVAAKAGFGDREITPHALRRSWIEIALQDRVPIRDVQAYVGHSTVTTTQYYDRRAMTLDRDPAMRVQSAVA